MVGAHPKLLNRILYENVQSTLYKVTLTLNEKSEGKKTVKSFNFFVSIL